MRLSAMLSPVSLLDVFLAERMSVSMRKIRKAIAQLAIGAAGLCAAAGLVLGAAPTLQDLQDQIGALSAQVTANAGQSSRVVEIINALIGIPLSIVVGSGKAPKGTSLTIPVIFTKGTPGIVAMQFDIKTPTGITVGSVTAGESPSGAQKSTQSASVSGATRILMFGINQTVFNTGVLVRIHLNIAKTVSSGNKTVTISGIVGSDVNAATVPLNGVNGTVTVQ